jgi:hypothetical protein
MSSVSKDQRTGLSEQEETGVRLAGSPGILRYYYRNYCRSPKGYVKCFSRKLDDKEHIAQKTGAASVTPLETINATT